MARNITLQVKLTSKSKKKFENKMNNLMKFVQPNRALAQLLGNLAMDIKAEAAMKAPVDNGDLRKSGYMEGSKFNLEVGFNAKYARAVEFGTAPHIIRSKKGKILTNYNSLRQGQKKKGGVKFFGYRVKHPGTKAQPFFFPVVNKEVRLFTKKWQDKLQQILRKS